MALSAFPFQVQPIRPLEGIATTVPKMLQQEMSGIATLARAMGAGRRGAGTNGTVETLSNGQKILVQGKTDKEREASRAAQYRILTENALKNNKDFAALDAAIQNNSASVEKQQQLLDDFKNKYLNNTRQALGVELGGTLDEAIRDRQSAITRQKVKVESSDGFSAIGALGKASWESVKEAVGSAFTTESAQEKLERGRRVAQARQQAIDNNAYLRNQQLLEQEGSSPTFSETGSILTNIGGFAADMGTQIAPSLGAAILGAKAGGSLGAMAGPWGAIGGAIGGGMIGGGLANMPFL